MGHEQGEPDRTAQAGSRGRSRGGGTRGGGTRGSRSRGRRMLGGLAWLVLGSLVAAVGLVLALDLGWQRDRIVGIARAMAEERLGLEVSIDEALGRLSRGIELRGVRVGEPGAPPLARAESIRLRWRLASLVTGERWVADRVRVEGWSLRLRRGADGRWASWDDLLERLGGPDLEIGDPSSARPTGPSVRVHSIEIGDGELDLVLEPRVTKGNPNPTASGVSDEPLHASLRAAGEIFELRAGPVESTTIERARFEADLVAIRSGRPDFDEAARARLDLSIVGSTVESLVVDATAPGLEAHARATGEFGHLDPLWLEVEVSDLLPLSGWLQTSSPLGGQLRARAELSGSPAAWAGKLDLKARSLQIEGGRAREFDLGLEIDEPIAIATLLDARVGSSGLRALSGSLQLHVRGLDPGPVGRGWLPAGLPAGEAEIDLEGSVAAGGIELRDASLRFAGLTFEAHGRGSLERIDQLDLRLDVGDLEPWLGTLPSHALPFELPLSGGLQGEARIEGPPRSPRGRIRLHSQSLGWAGRALGPLESSLVRKPGSAVEATLLWGSEADPALRWNARIDPGGTRMDFAFSGAAAPFVEVDPGSPPIEADVEGEGFVERTPEGLAHGLRLRSTGTVVAGLPFGRVELVTRGVTSDRIEISKLEVDGALGMLSLREPAALELEQRGAWRLESVAFTVALEAGVDGAVDARRGEVLLEAHGRRDEIDGFAFRVDAFPMVLVNRFRTASEPPLAGHLAGRASWHRQRSVGWTAGELSWTDPGLGDLRVDRLATRWSARPEAIDLELQTWIANLSPLALEGRIETPEPAAGLLELFALERLSFQAVLEDWDLAALQPFAPSWLRRIAGKLSGTLRVDRDGSGLRLGGEATLVAGGVTLPLLRQRFAPIEGVLAFDQRGLHIESLRVGNADEHASLTGSIRFPLQGSPEIEGQLRFERFPLSRSPVAWMDVMGGVRLEGTLARPVVRGQLAIQDARIGVPGANDPILKEIRVTRGSTHGSLTEAPPAERALFAGADLDVQFTVPGSTRIRGRGANLFVEGEARVVKVPGESARIRGEARVVNGTYTFQGRRFQVRRGRVLLPGDQQIDPVLDVEARLPVAEIVAIVEISGRLSSPIVRLRSEPPRSDQDVLAYLLFGRPADEVGAAGGTRFDAAAARVVAGVAEQELREVLGDAMPVDSIEIGADGEGGTSELGFGKYLSRNLFFRYTRVLGDKPADRVGAEYRLNDDFSIGSSVSTTGEAGLDLILRHDF